MKMAFLVICPGSFQYNEEKEGDRDMDCARERERERRRGCRKGGEEEKNQRERDRERGIRQVNIGKVREELSSSLERDMLPLSELIIILNKS